MRCNGLWQASQADKYARQAQSQTQLRLLVTAGIEDGHLGLTIEDNGRGDARSSGNGHGLELHSTLMAIAGGLLLIETIPEEMTRARLVIPLE